MTTLDILRTLVGFDTVSARPNLELITWIGDFLAQRGIKSHLTHNDDRTKANLWATIGPDCDGGVILSGHTDVVPVEGQPWSTDPFVLTERDGLVYGRGTSDMKSFAAAALSAVDRLAATRLARPVHLAFSYDEEVGCLGVRRLIEGVQASGRRPAACIVGEPTLMKLVVGQKSYCGARCQVRGFECHSSMAPSGVNAIFYAARIVEWLRLEMARRYQEGPFDPRYDPAVTTIHVGLIQGGTALNIVPRDCSFDIEIRALPTDDPIAILDRLRDYCREQLEPEMRRIAPDTGIQIELIHQGPPLDTDPASAIAGLVRTITGDNDSLAVAYGTESGFFHQAGIPTVICGPGSIEQAHKPDEFIALSQLQQADAFMDRLFARLASPDA